jgi:putative aldouronate transport system substrate-binding protein
MDLTASATSRWGEEGVDWSRNPADMAGRTNAYIEMGVFPKALIMQLKDLWTVPNNKIWRGANPMYFPIEFNAPALGFTPYDPSLPTANLLGNHYKWYIDKHPAHLLPALKYTAEEAIKISEPVTTVNEYVKQSIAEFVTGIRDINNDTAWNAYLRELNDMGLQQWLIVAQAAFDRQKQM